MRLEVWLDSVIAGEAPGRFDMNAISDVELESPSNLLREAIGPRRADMAPLSRLSGFFRRRAAEGPAYDINEHFNRFRSQGRVHGPAYADVPDEVFADFAEQARRAQAPQQVRQGVPNWVAPASAGLAGGALGLGAGLMMKRDDRANMQADFLDDADELLKSPGTRMRKLLMAKLLEGAESRTDMAPRIPGFIRRHPLVTGATGAVGAGAAGLVGLGNVTPKRDFQEGIDPHLDTLAQGWAPPQEWLDLQGQVFDAVNSPEIQQLMDEHGVSKRRAQIIAEHHIKQSWKSRPENDRQDMGPMDWFRRESPQPQEPTVEYRRYADLSPREQELRGLHEVAYEVVSNSGGVTEANAPSLVEDILRGGDEDILPEARSIATEYVSRHLLRANGMTP